MSENWQDYFSIRPAKDSDRRFIINHWIEGAYYGDATVRAIDHDLFVKEHTPLIEKCLSDPGMWASVACLTDDPDVIIGFAVGRQIPNHANTLHWVFVKSRWRGKGIAKELISNKHIGQVTQLTKVGRIILEKMPNVSFNPYFLREP